MKSNDKYRTSKMFAQSWCDKVQGKQTETLVAFTFNSFVPKNNSYRKGVLKCIRKINKKLFNAIINDKETECLNTI